MQIQERLRQLGVYDQIGGDQKLVDLAEAVPSAVNAPHYARIVAEKAKLRRLIDAAGQILYDAYHVVEGGVVTDIWPVFPRGPGHSGLLEL